MHANFLAKDVVLITLLAFLGHEPSLALAQFHNSFRPPTNDRADNHSIERNRTYSPSIQTSATGETVAIHLPKYRSITPTLTQAPLRSLEFSPPQESDSAAQRTITRGDYFFVEDNRIILAQDNEEDWLELLSTILLQNAPSHSVSPKNIADSLEYSTSIDVANIPEPLAQFAGQAITLYQVDGHRCRAWIDGFQLEQRNSFVDSTGKVQRINESLFGPPSDSFSDSGNGEFHQNWRNSSTFRLTATIATTDEVCPRPQWARLAKLPAPTVLTPVRLNATHGPMIQEVWNKLQANANFLDRQESYIELQNDEAQWKRYVRKRLKLQAWMDNTGGIRFVSAVLHFPEDQCHNWGAPRTLVWEISQGRFTRLFASLAASPVSIMDVDADGIMDVLSSNYRNGSYSLSYGSLDGLVVDDDWLALDTLDSDPC